MSSTLRGLFLYWYKWINTMQSLVRFVIIFVFSIGFLSGCANWSQISEAGAEMAQVPVTESPTGKTHQGKFIWHDLLTPDPKLAGKFYEQLFGWQIEYQDHYSIIRFGDKLIAGIVKADTPEGSSKNAVWMPSVSVVDVDAAADLAVASGGKVLKGPVDMNLRGRAALIRDPQGAELLLLNAKGGDPADSEAAIGDWLWDEIWTVDSESTQEFYQSVLGYDETELGEKYHVLLHNGEWRAGIRVVSDDAEHRLWVPVVRVADPEATVKRVSELGGVVWIGPDEAPSKGDTALIEDTTGALLLIQRWPPQASNGGL